MRRLHMAYSVSKSAFTEDTRNCDTHLEGRRMLLRSYFKYRVRFDLGGCLEAEAVTVTDDIKLKIQIKWPEAVWRPLWVA